jgi:hypothetical protein
MKKKASIFSLISLVIAAIVIVLFLAAWIFAHSILETTMLGIGTIGETGTSPGINVTDATLKTISQVDTGLQMLHLISFVLFFGLVVVIFLEAIFIRRHPVLFFYHIGITILAIVFSTYVSNEYEKLFLSGVLSATLKGFQGMTHILLNLPIYIAVIGIVGAVMLLITIRRDPEFADTTL